MAQYRQRISESLGEQDYTENLYPGEEYWRLDRQ